METKAAAGIPDSMKDFFFNIRLSTIRLLCKYSCKRIFYIEQLGYTHIQTYIKLIQKTFTRDYAYTVQCTYNIHAGIYTYKLIC